MQSKIHKEIYTLESHEGTVVSIIQPFPHSDILLSLGTDNCVEMWNISLGNFLNEICRDACPTKICALKTLDFLLIPKWNNTFALIDLQIFRMTQNMLKELDFSECETIYEGHGSWVLDVLEFTKNTKYFKKHFATCSRDKSIRIWDAKNRNCLLIFEHDNIVNNIIEIDSSRIASSSSDTTIRVWDLESEDLVQCIKDGETSVFQVEKIEGGDCLITRNESNSLRIWDYIEGELVKELKEHSTNIICLKMLRNHRCMTGSYDHTAKVLSLKDYSCIFTLVGHSFTVYALEELNNGLYVTGGGDGKVKVWDFKDGKCIKTFGNHSGYVVTLHVLKNNEIISGAYDGTLKIFKL